MLCDYWYWPEVLNKGKIKKVVNICESNVDPEGDKRGVPLDGEKPTIKTATITCTRWKHLSGILGGIYGNWEVINRCEFGYNLYPIMDEGLLNYNVYDSSNSGEYDFHIDEAGPEILQDIKLTAMINLSEEHYEGGDLIMFQGGKFRTIKEFSLPGSSIIFKSWLPHKVTPVTKGIRKTISHWFYGPRLI